MMHEPDHPAQHGLELQICEFACLHVRLLCPPLMFSQLRSAFEIMLVSLSFVVSASLNFDVSKMSNLD